MAEEERAVVITILEARNVKAADKGGTSDPYIKCWLTPPVSVDKLYPIKTPTVPKTVNPSWKGMKDCTWKIVVAPKDTLVMEMYDDDRFRDDFLGEIRTSGHDLIAKGEGEHWLPLRERQGGKPVGAKGDVCIHLTIK